MRLNEARRENAIVKSLNEFLGVNFEVDNDEARQVDGLRSWVDKNTDIVIICTPSFRPAIGRLVPTEVYVIGTYVESGGGYWDPPSCDWVDLGEEDFFEDAIFFAYTKDKKSEWYNKRELETMRGSIAEEMY